MQTVLNSFNNDLNGLVSAGVKRSASPTLESREARRREGASAGGGGGGGGGGGAAVARARRNGASPAPPAASAHAACPLMLNVLLADTVLNVFRDHNFDSCTLCVCNAGPKVHHGQRVSIFFL